METLLTHRAVRLRLLSDVIPPTERRAGFKEGENMDRLALLLVVVGALNWGSIGLFQFDIVAWICGGQSGPISRVVYTLVALAGIWCISLFFRKRERLLENDDA